MTTQLITIQLQGSAEDGGHLRLTDLIKQLEVHRLEELPIRNAIFLHGDLDQTYSDLYKKLKIPSHAVSHAGHACHLENPVDTARQIKILIDSFS